MRKSWGVLAAFATVGLTMSGCAQRPAPADLLERHVEARGGRAALQDLHVIERRGSFTFHALDPNPVGTYHTCIAYPDRVTVDVNAGPVQVHQVLGGSGALECDEAFEECAPATADVLHELEDTARWANREELQKDFTEMKGVEPLERDGRAIGYRYDGESGPSSDEFDPETGLITRMRRGPRERQYGDWRDLGGFPLPMRIEDSHEGRRVVTIQLETATHTSMPGDWCLKRFAATPGGG